MKNNDFIKVLIVDDEFLVRELLKRCIDWESIGMKIVAEASNSKEGLDYVEKYVPDIIFTDIYMPFIDGIEFSKMAIEKYPHIKIIVLTGHEEFEYAKRSIKVGVSDFLLKPINDDIILKVALDMKDKILQERNHEVEYNRLKKQLEDNLPYLRNKFLNELMQISMDYEAISHKLDYYQIPMKNDYFQVAIIEINHNSLKDSRNEEEKLMLNMKGLEQVQKFFKKDVNIYVFVDNEYRIVILSNQKIDLNENCELIKTMLLNTLKSYICIGIGGPFQCIEQISLSYDEAVTALNYKVVAGNNEIINYNDIHFSEGKKPTFQNKLAQPFVFYLKAGIAEEVDKYIEQFFHGFYGVTINSEAIRIIGINIIANILNATSDLGIKVRDITKENDAPYEEIFKIDNLPDMKSYLKEMARKVVDKVNNLNKGKASILIGNIKQYLDENSDQENLSLSNVAKTFFLNSSYLSRIFKQEMGQTFVEYLTKIRMEKAILLVKTTDMKVYQIADKVGFVDPHYFSNCFKKYTGMSVSKFKNNPS